MPGLPVPEAAADFYRAVKRGGIGNTLWKIGVLAVVIAFAIVLVAGFGVVGAAIGAILLSALIEEEARAFVLDVWNRDFERIP